MGRLFAFMDKGIKAKEATGKYSYKPKAVSQKQIQNTLRRGNKNPKPETKNLKLKT